MLIRLLYCHLSRWILPYIFCRCQALEFIERNASEFGIHSVKPMKLSGAFNCRLMHSAIAPLSRTLQSIDIAKPIVPVHSTVTTRQHRGAESVRRYLLEQIWKPVRWEQMMHTVYSRPMGNRFPSTFEVGPGRQLGTFLKQINAKAYAEYANIDVWNDFFVYKDLL